jgi:hypothetical protein
MSDLIRRQISELKGKKNDKKVFYNIVLEKLNFRYKNGLFSIAKNLVILTGVFSGFGGNTSLGDQLYKNKINL